MKTFASSLILFALSALVAAPGALASSTTCRGDAGWTYDYYAPDGGPEIAPSETWAQNGQTVQDIQAVWDVSSANQIGVKKIGCYETITYTESATITTPSTGEISVSFDCFSRTYVVDTTTCQPIP